MKQAQQPHHRSLVTLSQQFTQILGFLGADFARKRLGKTTLGIVIFAISALNSLGFSSGDRIQATANLNVRGTASTSGSLVTVETNGSQGKITSGPTSANGYTWWNISWNNGYAGWSVQDYLQLVPATPPTVQTLAADLITINSARLNSSVNPNGYTTTIYFQYGTTLAYGNTTSSGNIGTAYQNYGFAISGLQPGITIHYRIVAVNSGGTSYGTDSTFTTLPQPAPTVQTLAADLIATTSARLNGYINPNGSSTTAYFEYGTSPSYGSITSSGNFGTGVQNIGFSIGTLPPNTTFHYRLVASNSGGTSYGGDIVFTTSSILPPSVQTQAASGVTNDSATLNGEITPNGTSASFYFEYGSDIHYGTTTAVGSTAVALNVSDPLTGLPSNSTIHYRFVGFNSGGTNYGNDVTFTTTAPSVPVAQTLPATLLASSSATLNGIVTPQNGLSTAFYFQYGTTTGYGVTTASGTCSVPLTVSAPISGLPPSTLIHCRFVCNDHNGPIYGADVSFLTTASITIPQIITQPHNQAASVDGMAILSTEVSGAAPLKYQWYFNGAAIPGAVTNSLTLGSLTVANSGSYFLMVTNQYGMAKSDVVTLAVLFDGANQFNPAQLTMPPAPGVSAAKNLILITHGWQPALLNPTGPPAQPWMVAMTNDIIQQLINGGKIDQWQVVAYYWLPESWTLSPDAALNNAEIIGTFLGRQIAAGGYQSVHLIGHSAGAGLIDAAAHSIRQFSPSTIIQETFLDPFTGQILQGREHYGQDASWSDDYFVVDFDTDYGGVLAGQLPFTTSGQLKYAYNVDVGATVPLTTPVPFYSSSGIANSTAPVIFSTSPQHSSPIDFYLATIKGTAPDCASGFGYPFSLEANGAQRWQAAHLNESPVPLCGMQTLPQPTVPTQISPPIDFSSAQNLTSGPNVVFVGNLGVNMSISAVSGSNVKMFPQAGTNNVQPRDKTVTSDPTWLAVGVFVTNSANYVQFDTGFSAGDGGNGLVTVYWNTNLLGVIDERVTDPGLGTHLFSLPGLATNGFYNLTFRLDAFNTYSTVLLTNIVTGLSGTSRPITLNVASTSNCPVISFSASTNSLYLIQSSPDLRNWSPTAVMSTTNGLIKFVDVPVTNSRAAFYRVKILQ